MDGYTRITVAQKVITATVVGLDTRWQTIADGSNPPTDQTVGSSNLFGRASFAMAEY